MTEEIAEKLRRFGKRIHVLVVPNTAYPQTISPSAASSSGHYAIFPSSLSPWHGVETLLKATLSPHWPENLTVVIAGEGRQLPMALEFAEQSPRVRCVGVLKTDELAKCMLGARMGLCLIEPLPNREVKEVYPLKLFEMMAFRLPVIATDLAGQRDVISHSNAGILVPPGDPEALAKAVSELNSSSSRELMAEAAVTAVLEMYNRQDSAAQFDRIISEAANGGRRR